MRPATAPRLPFGPRALGPAALVLAAGVFAVSLAVGTVPEGFLALLVAASLCGLGLVYVSIVSPRIPLAVLFAEVIAFPVLPVTEGRGLNPEDVLLPVLLAVTWTFTRDHAATGPRAHDVEARRRNLLRVVGAYYLLALVSIVPLALSGQPTNGLDSFLALVRSFQGALFFYLVSRHALDRKGIERVRDAVLACVFAVFGINLLAIALGGVPRAGSSIIFGSAGEGAAANWSVGRLPVVMTSPNELGAACVLVWALLIGVRPRKSVFVLGLVVSFVLLLMTQSRSGMAAWLTFVLLLGLRRGRRKLLLLPLLALAVVPLLPEGLRDRIVRTAVLQRGSFEAYSSLIRVYCWQTSWKVFLAHPLTGVGYLGFRYVSHLYNSLGIKLWTAEEFFLEIASGLGILGPIVVGAIGVTLLRLARLTRSLGEPGSIAHDLGAVTPAFLAAVVVGNLTGDNLIGLLGVSQIALYAGLLAQAARIPECQRAPGTGA